MTSWCLALVTGMQLSFRTGIFGRSPTVGPHAAFKNFSWQLHHKSWHQLKVEHYTEVREKAALNGSNWPEADELDYAIGRQGRNFEMM
jgi:hypothetical protein